MRVTDKPRKMPGRRWRPREPGSDECVAYSEKSERCKPRRSYLNNFAPVGFALLTLSVIDWFIDFGKSGTTFEERPEFQRLRERVETKPNFHAVVCYDESRWGR